MKHRVVSIPGILLILAVADVYAGPVVLETATLRLEINKSGTVHSLKTKPEGRELLARPDTEPAAVVYCGGEWAYETGWTYAHAVPPLYQGGRAFPAASADLVDDRLTIGFGDSGASVTYKVVKRADYLMLEVADVRGGPVHHLDLLRLPLRRLPNHGAWLNIVCDDRFGVCLCVGNARTDAQTESHAGHLTLKTMAEADSGLIGARAVLIGCAKPRTRFLDVMEGVERDLDLPPGARLRRSPMQRYSYLWADYITPENAGRYIAWAKRSGMRMVLFSYTAFSKGAGHFVWNESYPNGMGDLKKVADMIRAAGLHVGLHIHYCKARKGDPYTTPVPDHRLHKERRFTLAAPLDAVSGAVAVKENPAGCTLDKGRRILHVGDELIAYTQYTTQPPYQFTGCERGHLKTTATAHRNGTEAGLLDVDTWDIFIRYDQNTDIQDETARRLADIVSQTGPYEMVYFDGAEDVHAPYWYHIANAQYRVWRLLHPPPPVTETPRYPNFAWHLITRGNAYDRIAPPDGMKDFCDLMACPSAAARVHDFSRIEFGWLGNFGDSKRGCAGPDVFEYIASRAAAWDCPISIQIRARELESNPRGEDCADVLRTWEEARLGNRLTEAHRRLLRNVKPSQEHYVTCYHAFPIWENYAKDGTLTPVQREILAQRREHHLFINEKGRHELVEIKEVPLAVGSPFKAFRFQRVSQPGDTYVLIWARRGTAELRLPVAATRVTVLRPFGKSLPVKEEAGQVVITIGNRHYFQFRDTTPEDVTKLFSAAKS
ncbi:MAG: hypothetical protein HZA88_22355 [Verrucomicrobia bacterium]|nr:hypothetical protein [Verrucomicrobiota bacterium]